jgi:hypothetical protein
MVGASKTQRGKAATKTNSIRKPGSQNFFSVFLVSWFPDKNSSQNAMKLP